MNWAVTSLGYFYEGALLENGRGFDFGQAMNALDLLDDLGLANESIWDNLRDVRRVLFWMNDEVE